LCSGSANKERHNLNDDLAKYKEENKLQHQEIRSLVAKLTKVEEMNAELSSDNSFLTQQVSTTKQTQDLLCTEILELKEQYAQVSSSQKIYYILFYSIKDSFLQGRRSKNL